MSAAIEVRDVCPRDGLQDHPAEVATDIKAELIRRLYGAGLRAIEVTSFVSPKVVPRLADADQLCQLLDELALPDLVTSAFVANSGGVSRAQSAGIGELSTTVPATDGMSQANFRRSRDEMLALVTAMRREQDPATVMSVTVAVAFGCPFDGPVSTEQVLRLVDRLAAAGYQRVLLGDTIGVADPHRAGFLVSEIVCRFPGVQVGGHFHDSRGAGIANVVAAVDSGATIVDASVAGLGGCPFAPGAAGNVATEDVAWLLRDLGYETGVDLAGIVDVACWVRQKLGVPDRSRTPSAVRFAWEDQPFRGRRP